MLALLQFDSVNVPLLERLIDQGRLPALAELRRRGRWQPLVAPDAHIAAAVYHSLHSGTEVEDHGIYHTFMWSAPEQRIRFMDAFPKPETIWERLSRGGRRSLVIDPFISWPPDRIDGVCVSGWQMRNRIVLRRWSAPDGTHRELETSHGKAPLVEEILGPPSASRLLRLTRRMIAAPERAASLATDLLARDRFDLAWVTLAPAHFAGHWLWDPLRFFDGELDAGERRELEEALPRIYEAVDTAIGRIVEALPADADLIVHSPTGIGANTSRSHLLPGMLEAVLNGGNGARAARRGGSRIWRMRAALPPQVRSAFSRLAPARVNHELVAHMYTRGIDWSKTRVFPLPGETDGLLRLNLRGREREGIVDPSGAEDLMEEIAAGLESFHDPDGAPAIAAVEQVGPRAIGPRADRLPDLLVRWNVRPSDGVEAVSSSRFGDVVRDGVGTGWPGNHIDQAWALLAPGRSSRLRQVDGAPRLVDIGATAAGLLGAPQSGLRGHPLLEPVSSAQP